MNRLELAIFGSAVAMFTILMVFDIYQWIKTPVTPYAINHWVPELLTILLIGRWVSCKMESLKVYLIAVCVLLYPILTVGFVWNLKTGISTGCTFMTVFLMGGWTVNPKEREVTNQKD